MFIFTAKPYLFPELTTLALTLEESQQCSY